MENIQNFINEQIKIYEKELKIEINLGKKNTDFIFNNLIIEENIINEIIKSFRIYKLRYSQGKIYKDQNYEIKTYNNKNTSIIEKNNLENIIVNFKNTDLLISNNSIKEHTNIYNKKLFNEENVYDEISIYLNDYIILFFQNIDGKYYIKYDITLEKSITLKLKNEIFDLLEKSLIIIKNLLNE